MYSTTRTRRLGGRAYENALKKARVGQRKLSDDARNDEGNIEPVSVATKQRAGPQQRDARHARVERLNTYASVSISILNVCVSPDIALT